MTTLIPVTEFFYCRPPPSSSRTPKHTFGDFTLGCFKIGLTYRAFSTYVWSIWAGEQGVWGKWIETEWSKKRLHLFTEGPGLHPCPSRARVGLDPWEVLAELRLWYEGSWPWETRSCVDLWVQHTFSLGFLESRGGGVGRTCARRMWEESYRSQEPLFLNDVFLLTGQRGSWGGTYPRGHRGHRGREDAAVFRFGFLVIALITNAANISLA